MRVVIQRTEHAYVKIKNNIICSIGEGMLILMAVEDSDTQEDIDWLVKKIIALRIFDDKNNVMNMDIRQNGGDILVVSQFTLFASTKKGNRPSYIRSSKPDFAKPMYEKFVSCLQKSFGKQVFTGHFGADMEVGIVNDGPVTIIIDTKIKE